MKKNKYNKLESRRISETAADYRKKGYRVLIEPSEFPNFITDYIPDLIAMSDDDNVILEVVSGDLVKNKTHLVNLAKIAEGMPGWRFEIIVTNPKREYKEEITLDEVEQRIRQVETLKKQELFEPALLLLWSGIEVILRKLSEKENLKNPFLPPIQLVKTLYSMGIIGRPSYEILEVAAKARNNIIHGYKLDKNSLPVIINNLLNNLYKLQEKYLDKQIEREKDLTVNELIDWFLKNYEDPANGVPYETGEGGYIYYDGGPYDPWEELANEFPNADEKIIEKAANKIYDSGAEWVRKGQY